MHTGKVFKIRNKKFVTIINLYRRFDGDEAQLTTNDGLVLQVSLHDIYSHCFLEMSLKRQW